MSPKPHALDTSPGTSQRAEHPIRNSRRRFQFSLRVFLLFLTAFGIWLGAFVNRAHQQRNAIDRLRALEGRIVFDYQGGITSPYLRHARPPGPAWLRRMTPPEYFNRVTVVNLVRSPVTDDDFAVFQDLRDVREINISDCQELSGRGFQHLHGLTQLSRIYIHATPITDEGAEQIKRLRQLESLTLYGSITDDGMEELSNMNWLSELHIGSPNISKGWEKGLREALPNCKVSVGWTMY